MGSPYTRKEHVDNLWRVIRELAKEAREAMVHDMVE